MSNICIRIAYQQRRPGIRNVASIWRDKRNGNWLIKFMYGGKPVCRSCRTKVRKEAERIEATVEETLHLLNTGRIMMPSDAEPDAWIMSGGKVAAKPRANPHRLVALGDVCDAYYQDQLDKAPSTLAGERIHIRHLRRMLGENAKLNSLTIASMQSYVNARTAEDNGQGGTIVGKTIRKELTTFVQIWDWARQRGHVKRICPIRDPDNPTKWAVTLPQAEAEQSFLPWADIDRRISRGGITPQEERLLWKHLYLDELQITELLKFVREAARHAFIYPMFALAAFTGARRSEIRRSEIDDVDFDRGVFAIRERKRRRGSKGTRREVPLHPELDRILRDWIEDHPGGRFTIAMPLKMPRRKPRVNHKMLTKDEARYHFDATLAGSKWEVVQGYHVLRHSFGAICTRAGIPMNVIAKWMGHTTDEMTSLYQHIFPQDEQDWMKRFPSPSLRLQEPAAVA